jgi:hypothetical protein
MMYYIYKPLKMASENTNKLIAQGTVTLFFAIALVWLAIYGYDQVSGEGWRFLYVIVALSLGLAFAMLMVNWITACECKK